MRHADLILRRVRPMGGRLVDVAISRGRICAMGSRLPHHGPEIDGRGNALLPGLADHHIHLLATDARLGSISLRGLRHESEIRARIGQASRSISIGEWIRVVEFEEGGRDLPDKLLLNQWAPDHPLRIQDRTGMLWILNSLALEKLGPGPFPEHVERSTDGEPTGRIWRGDRWLRDRLPAARPSLEKLGRDLARHGITAVTDAGAENGPEEALLFAEARMRGDLPQRLMLMGREDLPQSRTYIRGPFKILLDEAALPDFDVLTAKIAAARMQRRNIAAHCVTATELAFLLAAFSSAGTQPGDRVEHGSIVPVEALGPLRRLGLTIVTQPAFVRERGDRFLREVLPAEQGDLYRLASFDEAGIPVAAGSDAPYGGFDPWAAIHSACDRKTAAGQTLGNDEQISPRRALALFLGELDDLAGPPRQIVLGARADLCLMRCSLRDALLDPSAENVGATLIGGQILWQGPDLG